MAGTKNSVVPVFFALSVGLLLLFLSATDVYCARNIIGVDLQCGWGYRVPNCRPSNCYDVCMSRNKSGLVRAECRPGDLCMCLYC
ncbi:hypothetical protein H6P81_011123 [Aristolochia fimbriata]|uniref:Defensin n=1 Tax=Aristolochia fimbriata TaxID=158543 RepID=A0AAV7EV47_ARIFI|nr:hypothetical protein H6P81_011123 [Aristolochia fimbriata]